MTFIEQMDELAIRQTFIRKWSQEQFQGSVADPQRGGYIESDDVFRDRIKSTLADSAITRAAAEIGKAMG